jgi:hypothetical protein
VVDPAASSYGKDGEAIGARQLASSRSLFELTRSDGTLGNHRYSRGESDRECEFGSLSRQTRPTNVRHRELLSVAYRDEFAQINSGDMVMESRYVRGKERDACTEVPSLVISRVRTMDGRILARQRRTGDWSIECFVC